MLNLHTKGKNTVPTRTMKVKNKHNSDYRTVGLLDCEPVDCRNIGISDCQTNGLSDFSYTLVLDPCCKIY